MRAAVRMAGWNDEYGGTSFQENKSRKRMPKAAMGSKFDQEMAAIDQANNDKLAVISLVSTGALVATLAFFLLNR